MNKEVKLINFKDLAPIFFELINLGKKISLTVTGKSMYPFLIENKDQVLVEKKPNVLKAGDIILYKQKKYVMHRILKIKKGFYLIAGDALLTKEKVYEDEIIGYVSGIIKNDMLIDVKKDKRYRIKEFLWRKFFFARRILLYIANKKGMKNA